MLKLNVEAIIWKDAVRYSREERGDGLLLLLTVGIVTGDGPDHVKVYHEIEPTGIKAGKNEDETRIPLSQIVERRVVGTIVLKDGHFFAKRVKREKDNATEPGRTKDTGIVP